MGLYSLNDLRATAPEHLKNAPDNVLIVEYAKSVGADPLEVAKYLGYNQDGGLASNRVAAGIDRYQANLYGLGGAVARKLGADSVARWMDQRREANEFDAATATMRARELGAVDDWREIGSRSGYVSDALNYIGGLGAQSLPYLGEALAGGLAARGLMVGTRAALAGAESAEAAAAARRSLAYGSSAGAAAASYPSSVAEVLSAQRESGGEDLGSAAVGGVPYAALNVFGAEGLVARGLRPIRAGEPGLARRVGTGAVTVGAAEGATEAAQEGISQYFGRMAVDPNETFFNEEANKRYLDSFIGGAALGGVLGGASGFRRPLDEFTQYDLLNNRQAPAARPAVAPAPQSDAGFTVDTDREVGLGLFPPLNPYDVGGHVTAFTNNQETDITTPQAGLFGTTDRDGVYLREGPPPVVSESAQRARAESSARSEDDVLLRDTFGVVPNKYSRQLLQAIRESGLDPEADELVPIWTAASQKGKAVTKRAYENAIRALDEVVLELKDAVDRIQSKPGGAFGGDTAQPQPPLQLQPAQQPEAQPVVTAPATQTATAQPAPETATAVRNEALEAALERLKQSNDVVTPDAVTAAFKAELRRRGVAKVADLEPSPEEAAVITERAGALTSAWARKALASGEVKQAETKVFDAIESEFEATKATLAPKDAARLSVADKNLRALKAFIECLQR